MAEADQIPAITYVHSTIGIADNDERTMWPGERMPGVEDGKS